MLGTKLLGWRHIGYVENDDYCQRVIAQRIKDGVLDEAPIFGDVSAFNDSWAGGYRDVVDVVTAGFPCQPFSVAGKREGADDERNLWPATIECIRLVRPRYALLENVAGLLVSGYFGRILGDLAESGYDCRWRVLSAAEMGAPHKRDRLWILAHTKSFRWTGQDQSRSDMECNGLQPTQLRKEVADTGHGSITLGTWPTGNIFEAKTSECEQPRRCGEDVANTENADRWRTDGAPHTGRGHSETRRCGVTSGGSEHWSTEPAVGRVAHGVAHRVDRLRAIGNGQVPAVVQAVWRLLND